MDREIATRNKRLLSALEDPKKVKKKDTRKRLIFKSFKKKKGTKTITDVN